MMLPRPEECTSKNIFKELETYVSMKTKQSAWAAHQDHCDTNLRRCMAGKRNTAMPAVKPKDGKGHSKGQKNQKADPRVGEAGVQAASTAAPAVRQPKKKDQGDSGRRRSRSTDRDQRRGKDKRDKKHDRRSDSRSRERRSPSRSRSQSRSGRDRDSKPRRDSSSRSRYRAAPATPSMHTYAGPPKPCYRHYMQRTNTKKFPKCVYDDNCKFCHKTPPSPQLI